MSTKIIPAEIRPHKKKKIKISFFDVVNTIILILFSLIVLYPFYQCVIISFSDGTDITMNGMVYLWPRKWSIDSFTYMIDNDEFIRAAVNSVVRTVAGALIAVVTTSGYAYALSHNELKLRKLYTALGLITMYFGGGLIPTFLVIRSIGLFDNFLVYILPTAFSMFNAMVFLANFRGVPKELEESATIDGSNELVYYFRILVPISMPVFACVLLFDAVAQWNAYYDCMIYTQNDNLIVLAHVFAKMLLTAQYIEQRVADAAIAGASAEELMAMRGSVSSLTTQMAGMVLTVAPIMCIYPFLQKYFIKGIMVGSLKG